MRLDYAVIIAGGLIAFATWTASYNAQRVAKCARLTEGVPWQFRVDFGRAESHPNSKEAMPALERLAGITFAECAR